MNQQRNNITQLQETLSDTVSSLSWSPDSKYLASTAWNSEIKIWGIAEGKHSSILTFSSPEIPLTCSWVDGNTLSFAGSDGKIYTRDLQTGKDSVIGAVWPSLFPLLTFFYLTQHTFLSSIYYQLEKFVSLEKVIVLFQVRGIKLLLCGIPAQVQQNQPKSSPFTSVYMRWIITVILLQLEQLIMHLLYTIFEMLHNQYLSMRPRIILSLPYRFVSPNSIPRL